MGRYQRELIRLHRELMEVYDPKTAMSDPRVHEKNQALVEWQEKMEGKKECPECDGYGVVTCNECDHENDCRDCDGSGLVDISGEKR